jgi:hypothetical protein
MRSQAKVQADVSPVASVLSVTVGSVLWHCEMACLKLHCALGADTSPAAFPAAGDDVAALAAGAPANAAAAGSRL